MGFWSTTACILLVRFVRIIRPWLVLRASVLPMGIRLCTSCTCMLQSCCIISTRACFAFLAAVLFDTHVCRIVVVEFCRFWCVLCMYTYTWLICAYRVLCNRVGLWSEELFGFKESNRHRHLMPLCVESWTAFVVSCVAADVSALVHPPYCPAYEQHTEHECASSTSY